MSVVGQAVRAVAVGRFYSFATTWNPFRLFITPTLEWLESRDGRHREIWTSKYLHPLLNPHTKVKNVGAYGPLTGNYSVTVLGVG